MDRYIKYALASIPLSAGFLYLAGIIYDSSYFGFWGLDSDLFPRSVNDTIVRGVLAFLGIGAKHSLTMMLIAFIAFMIFVMLNWFIIWLGNRWFPQGTQVRATDRNGNREQQKENSILPITSSVGLVSGVLVFLTSAFFILTFILAILTYGLSNEGDESAQIQYDQLLSVPWTKESIYDVTIINGDFDKKQRRMITCSITLCVFLTPDGVETINRKLITKIRTSVKLKK